VGSIVYVLVVMCSCTTRSCLSLLLTVLSFGVLGDVCWLLVVLFSSSFYSTLSVFVYDPGVRFVVFPVLVYSSSWYCNAGSSSGTIIVQLVLLYSSSVSSLCVLFWVALSVWVAFKLLLG
jgi:hypothetical protein